MPGTNEEPQELRRDLESIKDLLDEDEQRKAERLEPDDDADVPTLDDTIDVADDEDATLPDSAFKTLLSDAWKESVEELFADGRSSIEFNRDDWLPQDADSLSAALKIRIDKSVREWLEETLRANIDTLRQRMVHELSEELLQNLRTTLDTQLRQKGTDG